MRTFNYDRVKDPTYFNDNRVAAHFRPQIFYFCGSNGAGCG